MVDHEPLPQWTFGRVTLLTDAAHPMYLIGSNGASQENFDAEALVNSIKAHQTAEQALLAYEEARLKPTANIVYSHRGNGPEQVMQLVEERAPKGFEQLHDVISQQELEEVTHKYKQIAGFDKESLNAKQGAL